MIDVRILIGAVAVLCSATIRVAPPKCAILSTRDDVMRVQNMCPEYGLIFDFSPSFDGDCAFNTCNGVWNGGEREWWTMDENGGIELNIPTDATEFSRLCRGYQPDLLSVVPIDCDTGMPMREVESIYLTRPQDELVVLPSRNWWTEKGLVLLEFESTIYNAQVAEIRPKNHEFVHYAALTGCENGDFDPCVQYWYVLVDSNAIDVFWINAYVSKPAGVVVESVEIELVDARKGDLTDWQKRQYLDTMMFMSPTLNEPYIGQAVRPGDLLCVAAIAPNAERINLERARVCYGNSARENECRQDARNSVEMKGLVASGDNTTIFCFPAEKYSAESEQVIAISYNILKSEDGLRRRHFSHDDDHQDCCEHHFRVIVECDDDWIWDDDDECCHENNTWNFWRGSMFWIFFVVLCLIGVCLLWACFMGAACPTNMIDGWGYSSTSPVTQHCINYASNRNVDTSRKFHSTSHDTLVRNQKRRGGVQVFRVDT